MSVFRCTGCGYVVEEVDYTERGPFSIWAEVEDMDLTECVKNIPEELWAEHNTFIAYEADE